MAKKKPMKTEARPKKKKDQRTITSKNAISKNATSKSAVSKSPVSKGTVSRPAPKAAASVASRVAKVAPSRSPADRSPADRSPADGKSRTNSEKGPKLEKSLKPLAKVKAAPAPPPAVAKGPQKPSKPARRIPNAELNKIRTLLSQK